MYAPLYIAHLSTLYIAHLVFAHCIGVEPVRLHTLGLFPKESSVDGVFFNTVHELYMNCTALNVFNP